MLYNNKLFSLVGILCAGGFVGTAYAAPTVKKLGVSGGNLQTGSAASVSSAQHLNTSGSLNSLGSTSQSRAASLRLGTTAKPVTVTKAGTASKATNVVDANRLSIGKYIHNSGVNSGYIKPVSGTAQSEATSTELINLTDRVADLESKLSDLTLNVANNYMTESAVQNYIDAGTRANEVYDNAISDYTAISIIDTFPSDFDFTATGSGI